MDKQNEMNSYDFCGVNKFYRYEKSKQFVVFVLYANIGLVWERSNWI